jgi:predicted RNase H-like HicB family nuclease
MPSSSFTAVFMKVPEGYVAFIEELPGANTQAETMDKARQNLQEAVALVMEANRALAEQAIEGSEVIRESFALPTA